MARLPRIADLDAASAGWGFFLCARKEVRTGRSGDYLAIVLQDVSGEIRAKVFQDVDALKEEFDAGEFVKVQGRGNSFNQQLELVLDKIRRVMPDRTPRTASAKRNAFRCAPRPVEEMWQELLGHIAESQDAHLRDLLTRVVSANADRFRIWPAARQVHHAYRSGLLEHVLKIIEIGSFLAERYGARRDLVIAGAILHDIGKLQELSYDFATDYTVEGNLVGHIAIGVGHAARRHPRDAGFSRAPRARARASRALAPRRPRELGSPVEPMTIEAFMLAAADDLDAKIHQIRRHIADDDSDGPFTSYHRRLERAFYKG